MASILKPKLYIPQLRSDLVARPRLVQRMEEGGAKKLTLLVAPPGSGKTTLVSTWASEIQSHVAWLSLDEGDNDVATFLAYVIAALQGVHDRFSAVELPGGIALQGQALEMALTTLINQIAEVESDIYLILDDYHAISAEAAHAATAFLLHNLPLQMHLIVISRAEPPLPLGRMRLAGELTEIGWEDLRFTYQEAAKFFNQVMGIGLTVNDIQTLEQKTEGWIAGMQAAALSMEKQGDNQEFIETFSGEQRYLLDYLGEEVLHQQSEDMRAFLLRTSILEQMTGALCDQLSGQDNGRHTLAQLERASLFVQPLDKDGYWFRYHPLFSEFLQSRLENKTPDLISELHRRAATWYEDEALAAQAVSHALAAGDMAMAARLMEKEAGEAFDRGEVATVRGWVEALPEEELPSRPRLCLTYAWALVTQVSLERIEPVLRMVETALESSKEMDLVAEQMLNEVLAVRAMVAFWHQDFGRAVELLQRALEGLSAEEIRLRGMITFYLGVAHHVLGDPRKAEAALVMAADLAERTNHQYLMLSAMSTLAAVHEIQGRLRQAEETYRKTLHRVGGGKLPLPVAGEVYVGLGKVLREWNELAQAVEHIQEGIRLSRQTGIQRTLMDGLLTLILAQMGQRDLAGAHETIREAKEIAAEWDVADIVRLVEAFEARLWLVEGNLAEAETWARRSGLSSEDNLQQAPELIYLSLARVWITVGREGTQNANLLGEAASLLENLLDEMEDKGRILRVIEVLVLQAMVRYARGESEDALAVLKHALGLGQEEGFVSIFVEGGEVMRQLLRDANQQGIMPNYVTKLLAAFKEKDTALKPIPGVEPLIEPLSKRELEVLRLVAVGHSNKEITEELVIAMSTVKRHINHIYGKLGVDSRTKAVARARDLNLVE